ncbi:MAG: ABC transporter ATP-binding protein, partial [Deltaproteobacteria bacterium]|nr:ABC transporter ATP-binding protein [Deltaproteobacteria bacterium]
MGRLAHRRRRGLGDRPGRLRRPGRAPPAAAALRSGPAADPSCLGPARRRLPRRLGPRLAPALPHAGHRGAGGGGHRLRRGSALPLAALPPGRLRLGGARVSGELLRFAGVSYTFPPGPPALPPLLDGLELTIAAGEIVGLLGPNGSGKTTLLRLACGWLAATSGAVLLDGRPLRSFTPAERARSVAVVPQEHHFPFSYSVAEAVLMGRAPWREGSWWESAADRRLAVEAMELAGVARLAGRSVDTLSGGERQRVLVARALAQQPRLLLLDEPTSSLDVHHQLSLTGTVQRLARAGRFTVLAALHDLNLASQFCSRVVLLHRGRVHASGPPGEVLTAETMQ